MSSFVYNILVFKERCLLCLQLFKFYDVKNYHCNGNGCGYDYDYDYDYSCNKHLYMDNDENETNKER